MIEVLQGEVARGADAEDLGSFLADAGETIESEGHPEPTGDRLEVDELVGRTAGGGQHAEGIVEGALGHHLLGAGAATGQLHRTDTGALGQVAPAGFDRRHHGRARQRHAEDLGGDGHRGGGTHDIADPDGGGEDPFKFVPLLVVDAAHDAIGTQGPDV